MSDVVEFTKGLKELTDEAKSDFDKIVSDFSEYIKNLPPAFKEKCHGFAQDMTSTMYQLCLDVKVLYDGIYVEEPEEGEETEQVEEE